MSQNLSRNSSLTLLQVAVIPAPFESTELPSIGGNFIENQGLIETKFFRPKRCYPMRICISLTIIIVLLNMIERNSAIEFRDMKRAFFYNDSDWDNLEAALGYT